MTITNKEFQSLVELDDAAYKAGGYVESDEKILRYNIRQIAEAAEKKGRPLTENEAEHYLLRQ